MTAPREEYLPPLPPVRELGSVDGHGSYGRLEHDDEGRVMCHECGQWWRHLGPHLRVHGLTAGLYRDRHGLPACLPLAGTATRSLMRQQWDRHRQDHLADLEAARDPLRANQAPRRRDAASSAAAATRQAMSEASLTDLTAAQTRMLTAITNVRTWARAATYLTRQGRSAAAIARACNLSRGTVRYRLKHYSPAYPPLQPVPPGDGTDLEPGSSALLRPEAGLTAVSGGGVQQPA